MKPVSALLLGSLLANAALGGWWLLRESPTSTGQSPGASQRATSDKTTAATLNTVAASSAETAGPSEDPAALRDRLRALGFSEPMVRSAVRALVEGPRFARERALRATTAQQPWWQPGLPADNAMGLLPNRELRELRRAECEELARLLGPVGAVTPADLELFAFLPEEKAAQLAALRRDYLDQRWSSPSGPNIPANRTEAAEREKALQSDYDRGIATLLTSEEREQFALRTSTPALMVGNSARYFPGSEGEYRAIYDLTKADSERRAVIDAAPLESRGRAGIEAMQQYQRDLLATLGAERYAQWQQAHQADYTVLVELQQRFPLPPAALYAVSALPRQISAEAMAIAQDKDRTTEQKLLAVRALADDARARVRAILGDDLGDAYSAASARSWLDVLERGGAPMYLENGQRGTFGIGHTFQRTRLPAPTPGVTSPVKSPDR